MDALLIAGLGAAGAASTLVLLIAALLYWRTTSARRSLLNQGFCYEAMSRNLALQRIPSRLTDELAARCRAPELAAHNIAEGYLRRQERAMKVFHALNMLKDARDDTQWVMEDTATLMRHATADDDGDNATKTSTGSGGGVVTPAATTPRAARAGEKATAFKASDDPLYQTMAGLDDRRIFDRTVSDKEKPPPPKPQPPKPAMIDADDPNYQTLAGIGGDIFDAKLKPTRQPPQLAAVKSPRKNPGPGKSPQRRSNIKYIPTAEEQKQAAGAAPSWAKVSAGSNAPTQLASATPQPRLDTVVVPDPKKKAGKASVGKEGKGKGKVVLARSRQRHRQTAETQHASSQEKAKLKEAKALKKQSKGTKGSKK